MNPWLELSDARKVAADLQVKWFGEPYEKEDDMIQELWDHPLYRDDWALNVIWDDFDCMVWLQISTSYGYVPK